jgi:hypothetical protein
MLGFKAFRESAHHHSGLIEMPDFQAFRESAHHHIDLVGSLDLAARKTT